MHELFGRFACRAAFRCMLLLVFGLAKFPSLASEPIVRTNKVTREIRTHEGDVWVEDRIGLSLGIWAVSPKLQRIYEARTLDRPKLHEAVKLLLQGDDLEIANCDAKVEDPFMQVTISSRLRGTGERPARIRCSATYAEHNYQIRIAGERCEPYLLVYAKNGDRLLWVPEWDAPADLVTALTMSLNNQFIYCQEFRLIDDIQIRCQLKVGADTKILLEARPKADPGSAPSPEFLAWIHRSNKMSGNDWHTLFTPLKPAKAGYYVISLDGFTNRPPFLPPGVTEFSKRPMSDSELETFLKEMFQQELPRAGKTRNTD